MWPARAVATATGTPSRLAVRLSSSGPSGCHDGAHSRPGGTGVTARPVGGEVVCSAEQVVVGAGEVGDVQVRITGRPPTGGSGRILARCPAQEVERWRRAASPVGLARSSVRLSGQDAGRAQLLQS